MFIIRTVLLSTGLIFSLAFTSGASTPSTDDTAVDEKIKSDPAYYSEDPDFEITKIEMYEDGELVEATGATIRYGVLSEDGVVEVQTFTQE
ncbi:hypothetical protein ACE1TF_03910 [Geomicrobium sp. JSM 1781026]|uniref:hypothetical protein n=1 Tax=Geomicrobium sp. JSM 1781026 TaxID=3344580 RepID=UPI0035C0D8C2